MADPQAPHDPIEEDEDDDPAEEQLVPGFADIEINATALSLAVQFCTPQPEECVMSWADSFRRFLLLGKWSEDEKPTPQLVKLHQ